MKYTIVLMLLMITGVTFPQAVWSTVNPLPGSPDVHSISVVDSNVIFVASGTNSVYKTTNGGITWQLKNTGLPAAYGVYSISAVDSSNCVVGWLNSSQTSASLYRTTNGGTSWKSVWTLAGSFPDAMKMFSPKYGIFIGDPTGTSKPFQFRYTNDSGATWNLSPTAPIAASEYGVVNAIDFIDTNTIWVGSANVSATATTCKIFKTTNGINGTWSYANVAGTAGASGLYYQAIAFVDANNGMAGSNNGNIVTTSDGGTTWTAVTPPGGLTSFAVTNMAASKDGSKTIWISINTTGGDFIFFTEDFGSSWTPINNPSVISTSGMQHIQFLSSTFGYAGGLSGIIYKYSTPVTSVNDKNIALVDYSISQNYPNPFNPSTSIKYQMPVTSRVSIKVYNLLGQELETLVSGMVNAGTHVVNFNASNLSSGIYYYVIKAGNSFVQSKKMMLLK